MSSVAKEKKPEDQSGFFLELFRAGLYKPNQGRIVRQVTFLTIALLGCLTAWEIQRTFLVGEESVVGGRTGWGITAVIAGLLVWIGYRLVNYSVFADFLIAVEAEMSKVSWPSRQELWRASMVVMFVIFSMAAFLFIFDTLWTTVFESIGIRYSAENSYVRKLLEWIGIW